MRVFATGLPDTEMQSDGIHNTGQRLQPPRKAGGVAPLVLFAHFNA